MYVAVASTIVIRFVLSVVFGIWMNLGVIGVAVAMCCDWMARAIIVPASVPFRQVESISSH